MVDWWKRWLQFNVTAKLTMIASVAMSWRCAEWFMNLEDPTMQQSAFVSVIMGVMTGIFGIWMGQESKGRRNGCLLYTSPSPRDRQKSRMPSSA